jgi:hypothetical protein
MMTFEILSVNLTTWGSHHTTGNHARIIIDYWPRTDEYVTKKFYVLSSYSISCFSSPYLTNYQFSNKLFEPKGRNNRRMEKIT